MMDWYLLGEDKTPVKTTYEEIVRLGAKPNGLPIEKTQIDNIFISSVFLGFDHSFCEGEPPILFETMIFGGEFDGYQTRYTSYDDCVKGHQKAIEMVNNFINKKSNSNGQI